MNEFAPKRPLRPPGREPQATDTLIHFRVSVGHQQVLVRGANPNDAVHAARRQLCLELPRMWDVIQALDDSRFDVVVVDEPFQPPAPGAPTEL